MNAAPESIDIFLCHTGADKDWVRALAERLEAEQVDGRPIKVFFDEWDIAPGENILSRIEEGLSRARYVAVALSPALTRATWPTLEWQTQVYDDPHGKRARIIPLLVQKFDPSTKEPIDIPFALRLLRYLDFTKPGRFEREFEELLRRLRGQRPVRGRQSVVETVSAVSAATGPEAADPVEELLLGNLFPVQELPEWLHSDVTSTRRYTDIWKSTVGPLRVPFVIHGDRLYSFVPPTAPDSPFRAFLTGEDPKRERTSDVLLDGTRARHLVWICNDALREWCHRLKIRTPRGDRKQFYPPSFDGKPRMFSWGKGRPTTLAKVSQTGDRPLGVHRSARMQFMELGAKLYLRIEPGYYFTTDGVTPLEGRQVGIFSVKWGGREGNDTVLRQTLMWARLLAANERLIGLPVGGGASVKVAPVPVHGRSNFGILGDTGNIERLLSGEQAGEVAAEADTDELDMVAAAHERGEIEEDDGPHSPESDASLTDPGDLDEEREEFDEQESLDTEARS